MLMLELSLDTCVDLAASESRHGVGLFETLRVKVGRPLRLEAHLERLNSGCRFLEMPSPPPADILLGFLNESDAFRSLESGVLRLLAVDDRLLVFFEAWQPRRPECIQIAISSRITRWSSSPLNRYKTLSYLENSLLMKEARERDVFEVLVLNESGYITDGGRTNVFIVRDGKLLTPSGSAGALPGVARRVLLEAGLAQEALLTPDDFQRAEAVLLTNSLQGAIPVHGCGSGEKWNTSHDLLKVAGIILG